MGFEYTIFNRFFSRYDKRVDINKDYQGKGTLERYMEALGKSLDDEIMSKVDNITDDIMDPDYVLTRYIEYLEHNMGYNIEQNTLYIHTKNPSANEIPRRNMLRHITQYYRIKGTKRSYELMFGMMGFTSVVITEHFNDYGFDSSVTLDDANRRFDLKCSPCSAYTVALTGSLIANQLMYDSIRSILQFNEPINLRLRELTYNAISILDRAGYVDEDYVEDDYIASS